MAVFITDNPTKSPLAVISMPGARIITLPPMMGSTNNPTATPMTLQPTPVPVMLAPTSPAHTALAPLEDHKVKVRYHLWVTKINSIIINSIFVITVAIIVSDWLNFFVLLSPSILVLLSTLPLFIFWFPAVFVVDLLAAVFFDVFFIVIKIFVFSYLGQFTSIAFSALAFFFPPFFFLLFAGTFSAYITG